MSQRRVVVTGLGATTPLGGDVQSTWSALLAGKSGVRTLTEEWTSLLPVSFAARVAIEPSEQMERVEIRRLDRSLRGPGSAPPPCPLRFLSLTQVK